MKKCFENFDSYICTFRSKKVGLSLDEFITIPHYTKEDYDNFEKGIYKERMDSDIKDAIESFFKEK